jgi:hypothetical protein
VSHIKVDEFNTVGVIKPPLTAVKDQQNCFIANIRRLAATNKWEITYVMGYDFVYNSTTGELNCQAYPKPYHVSDAEMINCVNNGTLTQLLNFFRKEDIFEQNLNYLDNFRKVDSSKKHNACATYLRNAYHNDDSVRKTLLQGLVLRLQSYSQISLLAIQRFMGQILLKYSHQKNLDRVLEKTKEFWSNAENSTFILLETFTRSLYLSHQNNKENIYDYETLLLDEESYDPFSKALLEISNKFNKSTISTDIISLNYSPLRELRVAIPKIIASLDCSVVDKFSLWLCFYDEKWLVNTTLLSQDNAASLLEAYFPAVVTALETIFCPYPFTERVISKTITDDQQISLDISIDPELKIYTSALGPKYAPFEAAFEELRKDEVKWVEKLKLSREISLKEKPYAFPRLRAEVHKDEAIWKIHLSKEYLRGDLILMEDRTEEWLTLVSPQTWLNLIEIKLRSLASYNGLVHFLREKGQILLERLELPFKNQDKFRLDFTLIFPLNGNTMILSLYATKQELLDCQQGRFKLGKPLNLEAVGTLSFDAEHQRRERLYEHQRRAEMRPLETPKLPIEIKTLFQTLNEKIIQYLYPQTETQSPGLIEKSLNVITLKAVWSNSNSKDVAASIKELKFCGDLHNTYGPVTLFCLELIFLNPEALVEDATHIFSALRSFIFSPLKFLNLLLEILKFNADCPIELDYQDPPLVDFYFWLNAEIQQQITKRNHSNYFRKFDERSIYKLLTTDQEFKVDPATSETKVTNLEIWGQMILHLNKMTLKSSERKLIFKTLKSGSFSHIFSSDGQVSAKIDESIAKIEAVRIQPSQLVIMAPLFHRAAKNIKGPMVAQAEVLQHKQNAMAVRERNKDLFNQKKLLNQRLEDVISKIENIQTFLMAQSDRYKTINSDIKNLSERYKHSVEFPQLSISHSDQAYIGVYPEGIVLLNYKAFNYCVDQFELQHKKLITIQESVDEKLSLVQQSTQWKKIIQQENENEAQLQSMLSQIENTLNEFQPKVQRLNEFTDSLKELNQQLTIQYSEMQKIDKDPAFYQRRAQSLIDKTIQFRKDQFFETFKNYAEKELGGRRGRQFALTLSDNINIQHAELSSKSVNRFRWFSMDWRFLDWAFGKRTAKARLLKIFNAYENLYQESANEMSWLLNDESWLLNDEDNTVAKTIKNREDLLALQNKLTALCDRQNEALIKLQNNSEKWFVKNTWINNHVTQLSDHKNDLGEVIQDLDTTLQTLMQQNANAAVKSCSSVQEKWKAMRSGIQNESQIAKPNSVIKSRVTQNF